MKLFFIIIIVTIVVKQLILRYIMKNLFTEESCCLLEIDLQYSSNCGKGYEILFTGRTCYHKLMQIEAARYNLLVSTSVYQAPILPLTFFIRDPLFFYCADSVFRFPFLSVRIFSRTFILGQYLQISVKASIVLRPSSFLVLQILLPAFLCLPVIFIPGLSLDLSEKSLHIANDSNLSFLSSLDPKGSKGTAEFLTKRKLRAEMSLTSRNQPSLV